MATTIITKNGSGAPLAGNLTAGELAVDLTNKRLYSKDSGGNVIELGTTPSGISGGTIDNTVIGGTTPAAGTFTTANATTVDTTNLEVTNLKAKDGTSAGSIADATGVVTLASSVLTTADINGGTIDGTTIGGTTAAAGTFTTFTSTGIDDNATSTAITIDSLGRVGINTASPGCDLEVAAATPVFRLNDTDNAGIYQLVVDGALYSIDIDPTTSVASSAFRVNVDNAECMRIIANGNVGIGDTAPAAKLEVNGGAADYTSSATGTGLFHVSGGATSEYAFYVGVADQGVQVGHNGGGARFLSFETNETERMRIDSSGNVGIGISPSTKVHVAGNNGMQHYIQGGTNLSTESSYYVAQGRASFGYNAGVVEISDNGSNKPITFATASTERMRIDSSGNLLVGKTSTALATVGTVIDPRVLATTNNSAPFVGNRTNTSGTQIVAQFYINTSDAGSIKTSAGGTPAFASASDERLKSNITDHESELDNVKAIRTVTWDWNDEELGSSEGVVAQELQQTGWADLVSEGDDGYLQVSGIGKVETRLIKAIQEQQAMIETLQAEVAALKRA